MATTSVPSVERARMQRDRILNINPKALHRALGSAFTDYVKRDGSRLTVKQWTEKFLNSQDNDFQMAMIKKIEKVYYGFVASSLSAGIFEMIGPYLCLASAANSAVVCKNWAQQIPQYKVLKMKGLKIRYQTKTGISKDKIQYDPESRTITLHKVNIKRIAKCILKAEIAQFGFGEIHLLLISHLLSLVQMP